MSDIFNLDRTAVVKYRWIATRSLRPSICRQLLRELNQEGRVITWYCSHVFPTVGKEKGASCLLTSCLEWLHDLGRSGHSWELTVQVSYHMDVFGRDLGCHNFRDY